MALSVSAMETKVHSPQKKIYVINETGMPLTIIARGTLPISLSKKLPEGTNIPQEVRAAPYEHPLLKYNPVTKTNERINLPDILRKNFLYGQQISATPSKQKVYFGRKSLGEKRPRNRFKTQRMLQNFSDTGTFSINTTTKPKITSPLILIEYNATYYIRLTQSGFIISILKRKS